MRIAIFGTGGVGGYFGGRLAQAGHSVVFIARGAHLDAIQSEGLGVESLAGDFLLRPAEATADPASAGPVDLILVCVKAWQVPAAAAAMAPMLGECSLVLPLVNGVEAAGQIAAAVGEAPVLGGLCRIVSYIAGPGRIRHAGVEPSVEFGEMDGRRSDRAEALLRAWRRAVGVSTTIPPDIETAIWEKFLFIAPFSGVGSVSRATAGRIRRIPETSEMLRAAMEEVFQLALARGVALRPDAVDRTMAFVDELPESATSSMQRDIQEGRPSELEAQTGAVVRLARAASTHAPVNEHIYRRLLPAERRARRGDSA